MSLIRTIRNAEPADAQDIVNIFYRTWILTYPNEELNITVDDIEEIFKLKNDKKDLDNFSEKIKNLPDNAKIFVFLIDNKIVGVVRMSIKEEFNQLNSIYVLPEFQRKGIGDMLFKECLKYFDKNKKIIVHVATYNTKAINFYEKLGFVDNGKRFTEERHRMPVSKVLIPELEMEMWVKF